MPQTYHSGGQAIVKIGGVDYNANNVEFTEETNENDTTTTADWDAGEQMLYHNRQGTKRKADGTADLLWDSLNQPIPALRAGVVAAMTVDFPNGKKANFPSILIKSTPIKSGGMDNLYSVQISWGNKGKYTWI
jgi:hypothetical protein